MIKIIFNRDYHLGKWYKQGDSAELNISLAKRLINKGIVHDAPVEKTIKKEIISESKVAKKEKPTSKKVPKRRNSRNP